MTIRYDAKRKPRTCSCGAHAWVPLTRGYVTLLNPEDAEWVGQWNWSTLQRDKNKPRAVRRENAGGKMFYLHRELLAAASDQVVDHMNGDPLDNRRANLRTCTSLQNNWNSAPRPSKGSRFKGVSFDRWTGRWSADIRAGRRYRLGRFDTEEEAARAYDKAATELHGAFAKTNASLGLL